jgi:hypothetical protein
MTIKIYTAFDRPKSVLVDTGPGLTRQSDLESCDINNIVSRFLKTGELPSSVRQPQFMDCSGVDFQSFQNRICDANSAFWDQPWSSNFSSIDEFHAFMDSVTNGDARAIELAEKYGMLKPADTSGAEAKPETSASNSAAKPAMPANESPAKSGDVSAQSST